MADLVRDTALGQIIRFVTRKRVLQYPEERPDFEVPKSYTLRFQPDQQKPRSVRRASSSNNQIDSISDKRSDEASHESSIGGRLALQEKSPDAQRDAEQPDMEMEKVPTTPRSNPEEIILVDWYGPTDPDNPQNWSSSRKASAAGLIVLYTLAIYVGSSICVPSYGGVMEEFGVSLQVVSLTLSMYVLAYGIGPMLWSPLSEIPSIGRLPPYIITFGIFVILCVPTALTNSFAGLVVLRFLLGFFGSPCLATGAASMADLYSFVKLPYGLSLWALAATSGPAIAPMISGFSVPAKDWRWSAWELLWLSGPIFVAMFLLLPETSPSTILLRRAQRLRARIGTSHAQLKSQSEIDQESLHVQALVVEALWRPMQVMLLDPSIAFSAVYTALIYGIFYSFFEAFPLVFQGMHGFNLGEQGLTFLSILVGVLVAISLYWSYLYWVVEPSIRANQLGAPERRLVPALPASILFPVGLFMFAWTSSPEIHWIVPTISIAITMVGVFIVLQCIFLYLPISYPQYAASLFAGNDFARSTLAAATIHFSIPMYHELGVDRGVTLLAGLTVGCMVGIFVLWHYGARLRARSRFAPRV